MSEYSHTTAKVTAWNLAGYGEIPDDRLKRQVEGLALIDAEVVALVEINPLSALDTLRQGLAEKGLAYNASIVPQAKIIGQFITQ